MKHFLVLAVLLLSFVSTLFPTLALAALGQGVVAPDVAPDPAPAESERVPPAALAAPAWAPRAFPRDESLREEAFVLLQPRPSGVAPDESEPEPVGLARWVRFESGTGRTLLERELVLAGAGRWIGSETYYAPGASDIGFKGVWRDVEPRQGRVLVLTGLRDRKSLSLVDACHGDVLRRRVELEPGDGFPLGLVEELRERPLLCAVRRRFVPLEARFAPTRIISVPVPLPGLPRLACEYDSSGALLSWYILVGRRVVALRFSGAGPVAVAVPPSVYAASRARFEPLDAPPIEAGHERPAAAVTRGR